MTLNKLKTQSGLEKVFSCLVVAICLSAIIMNISGLACATLENLDTSGAETTLWAVYAKYWFLPLVIAIIGFVVLPKTSKVREGCLGAAIGLFAVRVVGGNWQAIKGTLDALVSGITTGSSIGTFLGTYLQV